MKRRWVRFVRKYSVGNGSTVLLGTPVEVTPDEVGEEPRPRHVGRTGELGARIGPETGETDDRTQGRNRGGTEWGRATDRVKTGPGRGGREGSSRVEGQRRRATGTRVEVGTEE